MSYGVWLVGAAGNVGACTIAGWAAVARGLLPPTGLVTFAPALAGLPLGALGGVPIGGHELAGARSLREAIDGLIAERVLPAGLAVDDALEAAQRELRVADTI